MCDASGVIRSAAKLLLLGALLVVSVVAIYAQPAMSFADAEVRGATIFERSRVTGMVLVAVRNRETATMSYGETFPGSGRKPDAGSLIRLCSLSKVLACDLLVKLVLEGKVTLTDPLQRFAPPGRTVPHGAGGRPITLLDLATHTSGLPREVGPYPARAPHFTWPDEAYRWSWLPKQKLLKAPGTEALYSNAGFDLLGDALAAAAGKTYAQLLNDRISQPLGLRDTTLTPSPQQCANLLRGSRDEGPCTDTQASGASGGVYSTTADMTRLLQYLLHVPGLPAQPSSAHAVYLKPAQLKSMQGLSHAGDPSGIGLGWIQLGDPEGPSMLMEKTGGGAGFTTYIALSPKVQTGIFLAVTDGRGGGHINLYREANNLLAALADVPPLPGAARAAAPARKRQGRAVRRAAPTVR